MTKAVQTRERSQKEKLPNVNSPCFFYLNVYFFANQTETNSK
tara:strand:- start:305 stop:430 length:126 start_codon:yes stop_codon:yes gene_type:complete